MSAGRPGSPWPMRGYALLLYAYPARYRARFGAGMCETFLRDHARVRARGLAPLLPFWIITIAQAVWFGLCERTRTCTRASRSYSLSLSVSTGDLMDTRSGALGPRLRSAITTDIRYALRLLVRTPWFTVTSVLSLAIGIAAATTIFGLADGLLFGASPGIRDAGRVVDIARTTGGTGYGTLSYPVIEYLREHARTLESMSATTMDPVPLALSAGSAAGAGAGAGAGAAAGASAASERVFGRTVSSTLFEVLQVRPALGRFFSADEDAVPDARPVTVLTHRFWRERFGADPRILGRTIRLNRTEFTVIGVAEPGFENPTFVGTDLWVPMAMAGVTGGRPGAELLANPQARWLRAVGRLKPGVTREAAQAELNALLAAFRADTRAVPESHGIVIHRSGRLPPPVRAGFTGFAALLLAFACGLLAIACSNVAGMLLARASARRGEIAARLALGASRGRLFAQLVIETLVLFACAGLAALPLTLWLVRALPSFLPARPIPLQLDVALGARTWLFAAGVSLLAALVFGLAPARHALRADVSSILHGRTSTAGRRRQRLRRGLVIAQVALSLAVAVTAGLLVRTLHAAARVDTGFRTTDVVITSLDTTLAGVSGTEAVARLDRVAEHVRTIGGVGAVAYARMVPLNGGGFALGGIRLPGKHDAATHDAAAAEARLGDTDWDVVSPDYFRTVGLPIVEGRAFTADDRAERPLVAIVNESFARAAWPGRSAIGQRFWQVDGDKDEGRPLEVIGVAKDAKYRTVHEAPRTFVYVPFAQQPQTQVALFVRHAPGRAVASTVRTVINRAEPGLPIILMQSFETAAALGLMPQRLAAWVAGSVGTIGVFLAALGLYGLAAFLVAQRTREIAIRMALGASRGDVRSLVLRQAAWLAAIGAILGLTLAAGLGLALERSELLVGVSAIDPITSIALTLLMTAVLFCASYLPARRAAAIDPAVALRAQ